MAEPSPKEQFQKLAEGKIYNPFAQPTKIYYEDLSKKSWAAPSTYLPQKTKQTSTSVSAPTKSTTSIKQTEISVPETVPKAYAYTLTGEITTSAEALEALKEQHRTIAEMVSARKEIEPESWYEVPALQKTMKGSEVIKLYTEEIKKAWEQIPALEKAYKTFYVYEKIPEEFGKAPWYVKAGAWYGALVATPYKSPVEAMRADYLKYVETGKWPTTGEKAVETGKYIGVTYGIPIATGLAVGVIAAPIAAEIGISAATAAKIGLAAKALAIGYVAAPTTYYLLERKPEEAAKWGVTGALQVGAAYVGAKAGEKIVTRVQQYFATREYIQTAKLHLLPEQFESLTQQEKIIIGKGIKEFPQYYLGVERAELYKSANILLRTEPWILTEGTKVSAIEAKGIYWGEPGKETGLVYGKFVSETPVRFPVFEERPGFFLRPSELNIYLPQKGLPYVYEAEIYGRFQVSKEFTTGTYGAEIRPMIKYMEPTSFRAISSFESLEYMKTGERMFTVTTAKEVVGAPKEFYQFEKIGAKHVSELVVTKEFSPEETVQFGKGWVKPEIGRYYDVKGVGVEYDSRLLGISQEKIGMWMYKVSPPTKEFSFDIVSKPGTTITVTTKPTIETVPLQVAKVGKDIAKITATKAVENVLASVPASAPKPEVFVVGAKPQELSTVVVPVTTDIWSKVQHPVFRISEKEKVQQIQFQKIEEKKESLTGKVKTEIREIIGEAGKNIQIHSTSQKQFQVQTQKQAQAQTQLTGTQLTGITISEPISPVRLPKLTIKEPQPKLPTYPFVYHWPKPKGEFFKAPKMKLGEILPKLAKEGKKAVRVLADPLSLTIAEIRKWGKAYHPKPVKPVKAKFVERLYWKGAALRFPTAKEPRRSKKIKLW
jgi:hypothetical protein